MYTNYNRIKSITTARKLYNDGMTIYCNPCNLTLHNAWTSPIAINGLETGESFGNMVNRIRYYNCSNETGKYLHFYTV